MSHGDVWAVSPAATNAALLRANASIAGAGAVTLLTNTLGYYGTGYKVTITSAGNDTGITFTIVGARVGGNADNSTEVLTGASGGAATSTYYYSSVASITASGASAGNVSMGIVAGLALPRCRIKGLHYVATASAGTIIVSSSASTQILRVDTPAVASAAFAQSLYIPQEGLLTSRSGVTDYATVALSNVTYCTLFCG